MFPAHLGEGLGKVLLRLFLAVHEENLLQFTLILTTDIINHLAVVAMARQRVYAAQLGAHLVQMAKDADSLVASHNLGPESRWLTVANTQHRCRRILNVVGQVVFHASGLHHAAGGDDDAGLVAYVELFALHHALDVVQTVEAEGVGVRLAILCNIVIETLCVQTHDVGGTD